MENVHATCVDINGSGILIIGQSGSGKSDLALRLIENKGAVLVSDDRTDLEPVNGQLLASAPKSIEGFIEIRGIGIVHKPFKKQTALKLAVTASSDQDIERYPSPMFFNNQDIRLPNLCINLLQPSAPDKVVVKLKSILEEEMQKT